MIWNELTQYNELDQYQMEVALANIQLYRRNYLRLLLSIVDCFPHLVSVKIDRMNQEPKHSNQKLHDIKYRLENFQLYRLYRLMNWQ